VLADPLGRIHTRLGSDPDLLVANLDTALSQTTRQRVPIL
jgi:predicted amidohydrolase